jgi:hypothetical protein
MNKTANMWCKRIVQSQQEKERIQRKRWEVNEMQCRNHPKRKESKEKIGLCYECAAVEGSRLYDEQDGKCAICHTPLDARVNGRVPKSVHLDHNHISGQIRGDLCSACNLGLGKFEDNPIRLREAADYLEKWNKEK